MTDVKCVAIGDPHFKVNNITECKELIKKVYALVTKMSPDFVVLLGDILDTHEKIHVAPFRLATKFITGLAKKVPVYLLIGNHDYCNNQQFLTDAHAFNSFKKIANVHVCDKPIVHVINDHKFVFCPYVPPDRFTEALDTLIEKGETWADAKCIFAHQEFYGCSYNPLMTSTNGDIWPDEFPLVVSGHIHVEQMLQKNIYYPGSSMQHSFGESGTKIIPYILFTHDSFKIHRIDLELCKKKLVYKNMDEVEDFVPDENAHVKLVIKGTSEEIRTFRRSPLYKNLQTQKVVISFINTTVITPVVKKDAEHTHVLKILEELIADENEYVKEIYNMHLLLHAQK